MGSTPASDVPAQQPTPARWALTGAIVFLVAYLSVNFAGVLSDRSLPLPGAPAADVAAYYSANPAATVAVALLQALSVLGFAGFARAVVRIPARARLLAGTARISVLAMLVSCALSLALAIVAGSASSATVQTLRLGSFYAGGVVNVVTLGLFVLIAATILADGGFLGAPSRWFGYVAGTLATLSVLSLVFYYASALLPVGRILSMVWTVAAAVVLARHRRPVVAGSPA